MKQDQFQLLQSWKTLNSELTVKSYHHESSFYLVLKHILFLFIIAILIIWYFWSTCKEFCCSYRVSSLLSPFFALVELSSCGALERETKYRFLISFYKRKEDIFPHVLREKKIIFTIWVWRLNQLQAKTWLFPVTLLF